jgi:ABC-type Fe3+-hydroxamate transport system substrate-binding protein
VTVRVVSLVPSATETLATWGTTPVAVTRFCERPDLPQVGGTKNPDIGAIVRLRPDLVVLCEEENRRADAEALEAAGVRTFVVRIDSLGDVPRDLAGLAAAVGLDPDRVPLGSVPPAVPPPRSPAVRAFVPSWRRPWMSLSGRCYGSDLLARLGVANIFAGAADRYPEVTLDEVAALAPDVVLAPTEPYAFRERHLAELSEVAPATLVDGQDLFWWGVRTPAALERLRGALATVWPV